MSAFTYNNFIEKVNEIGFLFPSVKGMEEFVTINRFADQSQWWTDDPETDPWSWKDRAAEEKKLAYGAFFDGKKGFIAPGYYSLFVDAFRPRASIEERHAFGTLGRSEWLFWKLLIEQNRPLGTHEYRRLLNLTPKNGAGALDAAVVRLQMTFDVIVAGTADMLDKNGVAYNTSMAYDLCDRWVPKSWMSLNPRLEQSEALERIYRRIAKFSPDISEKKIAAVFRRQLKLCAEIAG